MCVLACVSVKMCYVLCKNVITICGERSSGVLNYVIIKEEKQIKNVYEKKSIYIYLRLINSFRIIVMGNNKEFVKSNDM